MTLTRVISWLADQRKTTRYNLIWSGFLEVFFIAAILKRAIERDQRVLLSVAASLLFFFVLGVIESIDTAYVEWRDDRIRRRLELERWIAQTNRWRNGFIRSARTIRDRDDTITDNETGGDLKTELICASVEQARTLNWQVVEARRERGDYTRKERWRKRANQNAHDGATAVRSGVDHA